MKNILIAFLLVMVGPGYVFADLENLGGHEKTNATLSAGYYWVETEDNSGRAAEYIYQDVSGTASFDVRGGGDVAHFIVDGQYLNENDYKFGLHLDANHAYRFDLRTEKMFHNLDHITYDGSNPDGRPNPTFTSTATSVDRFIYSYVNPVDATEEYSLKIGTSEANIRAKLPDMPAHVNVGYWQFQKEGNKQLRFVDEDCAGACHMQSTTREVNRTTHQISGGFDAHLGKFDLIVSHMYREVQIDDPIPYDDFAVHFSPFSTKFRDTAGTYPNLNCLPNGR